MATDRTDATVVRPATLQDVPACKVIADANRKIFGFLLRSIFIVKVQSKSLLVVEQQDRIIGFLIYNHRKVGTDTTIYDFCIDAEFRGQGIGRLVIDHLVSSCTTLCRTVIIAKCPQGLAANGFYARLGFVCSHVQQTKKNALNVWKYELPATYRLL